MSERRRLRQQAAKIAEGRLEAGEPGTLWTDNDAGDTVKADGIMFRTPDGLEFITVTGRLVGPYPEI